MVLVLAPRITGQLGNRLTALAHVLAACRERGWRCANPFLGDYAGHFVHFRRTLVEPGPADDGPAEADPRHVWRGPVAATGQLAARGVRFLGPVSGGLLRRVKCPAEGLDLLALDPGRARLLSLQGYAFRSPDAVRRQRDWLVETFRPIAAHRAPAEAIAARLRPADGVLVGLHIRHGDYAQHQGGRFFYDVATYRRLADQVVALHAPRPVAFVICANVALPPEPFAGLAWAPGPGHFVADLHALAQCDVLLGPPSSFSTWAAFVGGGRLHRVEDPARPLALDDFRIEDAPQPIW